MQSRSRWGGKPAALRSVVRCGEPAHSSFRGSNSIGSRRFWTGIASLNVLPESGNAPLLTVRGNARRRGWLLFPLAPHYQTTLYQYTMPYALMSSGGKDSTLALDRARREGLDVRYLVNIYDGASQRVAFHGVRTALIAAQAEACGLEPLTAPTDADNP